MKVKDVCPGVVFYVKRGYNLFSNGFCQNCDKTCDEEHPRVEPNVIITFHVEQPRCVEGVVPSFRSCPWL